MENPRFRPRKPSWRLVWVRSALLAAALSALLCLAWEAAEARTLEAVAAEHYDTETRDLGARYHRVREVLFFVQTALVLGLVWWLAHGPLGRWREWSLAWSGGRPWLARVWVLTALYLILILVRLPFSLARFFHARSYGLRHDDLASFFMDWGKAVGVGWILLIVVGLVVLGLFSRFPRWWWGIATVAVAVLTVGYVFISPLVIEPLFFKFERLPDKALETRLLDLSRKGGVPAQEILVADASRRSRAVNAYFTGVGDTRRIVLYDTLVEKFDPDQVAMVVAHEIGHWKHHHIRRGLALGLGAMLLGLLFAHGVLGRWVRAGRAGVQGRGDPALALPAYALYVSLSLAALVPSNWISRQMEAEADRESLVLTRDPATFIRTETQLARENLSDVLPPSWIEFTLYTHPANVRRIQMAEDFR